MSRSPDNLARVVLYDPVSQNLRSTRYSLYEEGFRGVDAYSVMNELRDRLKEKPSDLVILETGEGDAAFDLVNEIRHGDIGSNPFCVIFVTTWSRSEETINRSLQCGADDLIVRPFSAQFMSSRVTAAIERRKQFVVTSNYIGPDRRSAPRADSADPSYIDPPNTLRAAAMGDYEALEASAARIEATRNHVRTERLRRMAMRLAADLEIADPAHAPNELVLLRQVRELEHLARLVGPRPASLASAMSRALSESGGTAAKRWRVARELAHGVCAVCMPDGDATDAADEIGELVGRLKKKGVSTALDGGQAGKKSLNSAA